MARGTVKWYDVKLGKRVIGSTYRDWHRPTTSQWYACAAEPVVTGYFRTKQEAMEWLHLLAKNPHFAGRVSELRVFFDKWVDVSRIRKEAGTIDPPGRTAQQLFDMLLDYAADLGYNVTRTPQTKMQAKQNIWGQMDYKKGRIFVKRTDNVTMETETLVHELVHHFEIVNDAHRGTTMGKREQLVGAVTYMVLRDLGIDVSKWAGAYLGNHQPKNRNVGFMRGELDKNILLVYTETIASLNRWFLQKGVALG